MSRSAYEARLRRAEESLRLLEFNARNASDEIGKFAQDVALFNPGWGYGDPTPGVSTPNCPNKFPLTLYGYHSFCSRTPIVWDPAEQAWLGCAVFFQPAVTYYIADSSCTQAPTGSTTIAIFELKRNLNFTIKYCSCPLTFSWYGSPLWKGVSCPGALGGTTPFGPNTRSIIPALGLSSYTCTPIMLKWNAMLFGGDVIIRDT